jgi:hypothetical protein
VAYEGLGARHTVAGGATKACTHGQIVSEDGFVGAAFKVQQISRYQDPTLAAAQAIAVAEVFELQLGGVHEAPASGNLAPAARGNAIYINSANNTLGLAAQGLTTGNLNAGWLPVGLVTEVDASRTPAVVRINATGEAKALVKVGTGG